MGNVEVWIPWRRLHAAVEITPDAGLAGSRTPHGVHDWIFQGMARAFNGMLVVKARDRE